MAPLRALHLAGVVGSALWALRKGKREETPPHFCCSVTGELYVDPVVVVSSGHTYERAAIEAWFATKSAAPTDPNTGCECGLQLVPNWALRDALNEWLSAQGRHALPPPVASAPLPRKRASEAYLEGPLGAALALVVTLAASLGGGVVAALFGMAPVTSLLIVLLLLGISDSGGAAAAFAPQSLLARARRR